MVVCLQITGFQAIHILVIYYPFNLIPSKECTQDFEACPVSLGEGAQGQFYLLDF